jgi:hypothetical protein
MLYNNYKNISDHDFLLIKKEFDNLKRTLIQEANNYSYSINNRNESFINEIVGIGFIKLDNSGFRNGFGLMLNDSKNLTFTINIIKSIDFAEKRLLRKEVLGCKILLGDLERNYKNIFKKVVSILDSWYIKDLNEEVFFE